MPIHPHIIEAHRRLKRRLTNLRDRDTLRTTILRERRKRADVEPGFCREEYKFHLLGQKLNVFKMIGDRITTHGVVDILDVGAGQGNYLERLTNIFGDLIVADAMDLSGDPELIRKQKEGIIAKIHNTSVESWIPKKQYDFIFSYVGGLTYSPHPDIATIKLAYSLKKGGQLIIFPHTFRIPEEIAQSNEFNVIKLDIGYLIQRL